MAATSVLVPQWLDTVKEEVQNNIELQKIDKKNVNQELNNEKWKVMDRVIFYKGAIYLSTDSALIPLVTNEFHLGTHEEFKKAF